MGKVHEKKSYNVVSNKTFNFGLLRSKKSKTIGEKRKIIDTVKILGLQVETESYLNPINISLNTNNVICHTTNTDIELFYKAFYLVLILKMKQMLYF